MTIFIGWGQRLLQKRYKQPAANSLAMLELAYALGYDGVEVDLRLTADNQLVLMHFATLDKATYANGAIKNFTAAELAKVKLRNPLGDEDSFIPSLTHCLLVQC